jgi:hypothetical protein
MVLKVYSSLKITVDQSSKIKCLWALANWSLSRFVLSVSRDF